MKRKKLRYVPKSWEDYDQAFLFVVLITAASFGQGFLAGKSHGFDERFWLAVFFAPTIVMSAWVILGPYRRWDTPVFYCWAPKAGHPQEDAVRVSGCHTRKEAARAYHDARISDGEYLPTVCVHVRNENDSEVFVVYESYSNLAPPPVQTDTRDQSH